MSIPAGFFGASALRSLQLVIANRQASESAVTYLRERVRCDLAQPDHATIRSENRPSSFATQLRASSPRPARMSPSYRAIVLTPDGQVAFTEQLFAENDVEALHAVAVFANDDAVDLWDGLRFIEHFESKAASDADLSLTTGSGIGQPT